jgi:hypothetical protein
MNKNLIEGRRDGVSWHNTAKPTGEVAPVNQAVVQGRTVFLPGEVCAVRAAQKSAEVVVVGKRAGVRTHSKIAGGLSPDEGPNQTGAERPHAGEFTR